MARDVGERVLAAGSRDLNTSVAPPLVALGKTFDAHLEIISQISIEDWQNQHPQLLLLSLHFLGAFSYAASGRDPITGYGDKYPEAR